MKDCGYVIKDDSGLYFIGYGHWDSQLRKAKIYHSIRYAKEVMNDRRFRGKNMQIVKIEIRECADNE